MALALPLLLLCTVPGALWPAWMGGGAGGPAERLQALVPAAAVAGFAWAFGRTLLPGRQPLIAEYIRHDERRDPEACAGYARGLTLFWAVAMGIIAAVELGAWWRGTDLGWAPEATMLTLFLGEHAVRSLRFPEGGIAWPSQTIRAILRAEPRAMLTSPSWPARRATCWRGAGGSP